MGQPQPPLAQAESHLAERSVDSQELFTGNFLRVRRDTVALPDGGQSTREYVVHPGAVMIVPLLTDAQGGLRVVLESQYRFPVGQVIVEFPAGKRDGGEDLLLCAQRELREETGIAQADLVFESAHWYRYDLPPAVAGRALRGRYRGQEQRWFLLRFTGREREIDLRTHHQEFSAWRWAEPDEVLACIVDFKRPVYEQVLAEFASHLAALRSR